MGQIFKTVMSMCIIILAAVILGSIVTANADSSKAKKYRDDVIQEIECGNMSQSVIDTCVNNAATQGYTLNVNNITNDSGKNVMCEVILKYNYSVRILNILTTHECRGFAR